MKNPLKTLEPNLKGRDFVIGDLHGSYSAFKNLLANINFDPAVDRMISVGDLCDRGPDSPSCLDLIREPWFHAVLSNHEQMMIEKFNGGWMGGYWYQNGGDWGMEVYNDYKAIYIDHTRNIPSSDLNGQIIDLLPVIEELPFLITVRMEDGKKFHVLHAELPYSNRMEITDEVLENPADVLKLAKIKRGDGDCFLWARFLFGPYYMRSLDDRATVISREANSGTDRLFNDKLSHVISGHTIVRQPLTIVGQTNIDTGAYKSYLIPVEPYSMGGQLPEAWAGLTCIELKTWKFFKATADTFEQTEPYVITKQDILDSIK